MLRITKERLRLGLSQGALARRADVDQALLSKAEARRVLYPGQLVRLAHALGLRDVDAATLLDEVDCREKTTTGPAGDDDPNWAA
jgi:transcriptional regulator with XRE-family HTH domain